MLHGCDSGHVSAGYIDVEGSSGKEHAVHGCDPGHVSAGYIGVEGTGSIEHEMHGCDPEHVPAGYVTVEGAGPAKHVTPSVLTAALTGAVPSRPKMDGHIFGFS